MTRGRIAAGFIGLITLSLIVGGIWLVILGKNQQIDLIDIQKYEQMKNDCRQKLEKSDSFQELVELKEIANSLNEDDKERFLRVVGLKFAQRHYLLAEAKIWRARRLVELTEGDDSPFIEHYVNESIDHYQKAKEEIDALLEATDDDVYNFCLYYTRGNIYYRVLLFIAESDEATEIFNQTAAAWEDALRFRNKDVETEINLELLYKNRDQLMGNGPGRGRGEKVRMLPLLPQPGPGIGGGVPHGHF